MNETILTIYLIAFPTQTINNAVTYVSIYFSNEHSVFVGELSEEVDDLKLFSVFTARYKSCVSAKGRNSLANSNCEVSAIPKIFIMKSLLVNNVLFSML